MISKLSVILQYLKDSVQDPELTPGSVVKGVAAVVKNDQGQWLIQDHVKSGTIMLPGGKVGIDEDPQESLKRELQEEIGVMSGSMNYKGSITHPYKGVTFDTDIYEITGYSGNVENKEPEKHRSIEWLYPEQIKTMPNLAETTKRALALIK
jgi:8-oxo-dGTP pyrophosphatase MutT (NUDIX family)